MTSNLSKGVMVLDLADSQSDLAVKGYGSARIVMGAHVISWLFAPISKFTFVIACSSLLEEQFQSVR